MSEPNSPSENPENPENYWERLADPDESPKAFEAFNAYLALPPATRSVYAAYCLDQQEKGKKPAKQTPGGWTLWSTLFKWKDRAAAHDNHLANVARQAQEEERKANAKRLEREHLQKLTAYREQLHDLNGAALSASVLLLDKCVVRLNRVTDEELDKLSVDKLGNLIRAATAAAAMTTAAQAQALAVDELIGLLDDEQQSDPED